MEMKEAKSRLSIIPILIILNLLFDSNVSIFRPYFNPVITKVLMEMLTAPTNALFYVCVLGGGEVSDNGRMSVEQKLEVNENPK